MFVLNILVIRNYEIVKRINKKRKPISWLTTLIVILFYNNINLSHFLLNTQQLSKLEHMDPSNDCACQKVTKIDISIE